jgi:hypothetical protein
MPLIDREPRRWFRGRRREAAGGAGQHVERFPGDPVADLPFGFRDFTLLSCCG